MSVYPEVQAFLDLWAEKSAAKEKGLEARGEILAAEAEGRDASEFHAAAGHYGRVYGIESQKYAEAFALAESFVKANAELYAPFERYVDASDHSKHDELVALINGLRRAKRLDSSNPLQALAKSAMEDLAGRLNVTPAELSTLLVMFELVRFERKYIGNQGFALVRKMV